MKPTIICLLLAALSLGTAEEAPKGAKPEEKAPALSTADILKVREIQLRIAAAQLAQRNAQAREQKALAELQQAAQEIHARTGCALRETGDDPPKLTCAEPPKPEPKKP